jgi:hypothetical protein
METNHNLKIDSDGVYARKVIEQELARHARDAADHTQHFISNGLTFFLISQEPDILQALYYSA